jgi:hypothetical protein
MARGAFPARAAFVADAEEQLAGNLRTPFARGELKLSSSLTVLTSPTRSPMTESVRVVIALCYRGTNQFLMVPECPYCYTTHKHKVEGIKPLSERHANGAVVPYLPEMPTKISECPDRGRTYALELRDREEVPQEHKKICRGVKNNGEPCSKRVRPDYCVCTFHVRQQRDIIERRYSELTGT